MRVYRQIGSRARANDHNRVGTLAPIGVQAAAQILERIAETHEPAPRHLDFLSFRQLGEITTPITSPTTKDIFDLFVKGDVDEGLLAQSLSKPIPSYVVRRGEINTVAELLSRGAPVVVILSRLANGKTLFSASIASEVRDRFNVFIFAKESLSLADEIRALRTPSKPTLIIIDDYARHIDLISELRLGAGANQYLLLTSQTPTHLTTRDRLRSILGDGQLVEIRVDTLSQRELLEFDSILAPAGLLGDATAMSQNHRVQKLYRDGGAGEFCGILLWLLDSPVIRERLVETFATLKGKREPQRVVIAAMILTHIGQPPDIDDIAEFIGADAINQTIFSEDSTVAELVRFARRGAYPRSSLFAGCLAGSLGPGSGIRRARRNASYRVAASAWQQALCRDLP
jgi:hypothetical protein